MYRRLIRRIYQEWKDRLNCLSTVSLETYRIAMSLTEEWTRLFRVVLPWPEWSWVPASDQGSPRTTDVISWNRLGPSDRPINEPRWLRVIWLEKPKTVHLLLFVHCLTLPTLPVTTTWLWFSTAYSIPLAFRIHLSKSGQMINYKCMNKRIGMEYFRYSISHNSSFFNAREATKTHIPWDFCLDERSKKGNTLSRSSGLL